MDWYTLAKFLHIVCAIIWLGGGFAVTMLALRADRANDDADLIKVIQHVAYLSPRMIVPASALTLVFGLILVWLGQSFSDLWIILGLAGFGASLVAGMGFIKPASDRVMEAMAREGAGAAAVEARRLLRHVKFDMALLYIIVADMVLKPTLNDIALLAVMAAALVAAALLFLGGGRRQVAARA